MQLQNQGFQVTYNSQSRYRMYKMYTLEESVWEQNIRYPCKNTGRSKSKAPHQDRQEQIYIFKTRWVGEQLLWRKCIKSKRRRENGASYKSKLDTYISNLRAKQISFFSKDGDDHGGASHGDLKGAKIQRSNIKIVKKEVGKSNSHHQKPHQQNTVIGSKRGATPFKSHIEKVKGQDQERGLLEYLYMYLFLHL